MWASAPSCIPENLTRLLWVSLRFGEKKLRTSLASRPAMRVMRRAVLLLAFVGAHFGQRWCKVRLEVEGDLACFDIGLHPQSIELFFGFPEQPPVINQTNAALRTQTYTHTLLLGVPPQ